MDTELDLVLAFNLGDLCRGFETIYYLDHRSYISVRKSMSKCMASMVKTKQAICQVTPGCTEP